MNAPVKTLHDETLNSLASRYAQEGYSVLKEPKAEQLPFDLGGYTPDLIATKGDTHLIIEVKSTANRLSIDRLQSIAEKISRRTGWRFLLVTLDDINSKKIPTATTELPTWAELEAKIEQARTLIEEKAIDPALLYLWSIFESALRREAIAKNIPIERLPTSMLLDHMYSQGEISVEQIDLFHDFMDKRNGIAHGAKEAIDAAKVRMLLEEVHCLIVEWSGGDALKTSDSS